MQRQPASNDPLQRLAPAMRHLAERIARAPQPPLYLLTAREARAAYEQAAGLLDVPRAPLARVEDVHVPTRDGAALPARLLAPSTEVGLPVLLYLHGGGFTIGSVETIDAACRQLALHSGAAVLALGYRLAPEHRFPTAVLDTFDALEWLAREGAHALGLDATRLAIGGDSAGGTLAAVGALHARDIGLPLALQLLIYPGTTDRQNTPSHRELADAPLLPKRLVDWFFAQYIDEADRGDWRFAPLVAADVDGAAPAWIGLAEVDPLVDEGIAYGDKLRAAGVPVELEIYRGMAHGFFNFGRVVTEARTLQRDAGAALARAFAQ